MTRPSRNQDQLLIDTAKRLLPEMGVSEMSLQRIADESGVNLGMFHYHFKTKAKFVHKVLESINEDLDRSIEAKLLEGKNPLEKLRSALTMIGLYILDQKKIILSMIQDLLNQDEEVAEFVLATSERRLALMGPLIEECQREGYIATLPFAQISSFLSVSVNFPTILSEVLERLPNKKLKFSARVKNDLASQESIIQRVDLAIKAVSIGKGT
jgi:AcrR family transcriptional regulator